VSWGSKCTISSIADTKGNTYTLAVGPTTFSGAASAISTPRTLPPQLRPEYGHRHINTSTGSPDLRVAEYSGVDTTNPLDVTTVSTGTSATATAFCDHEQCQRSPGRQQWVLSGTTAAGTGYTSVRSAPSMATIWKTGS